MEAWMTAPSTLSELRGKETILVIDDEESLRRFLAAALERQGYVVLQAATPDEARRACDEVATKIDLLVADLGIPGCSGTQLANELLARHPGTKVLFISGAAGRELRPAFSGRIGAAFVQKPFTLHQIASQVRATLDGV